MVLSEQNIAWLESRKKPIAVIFNAHVNALGLVRSLAPLGIPVAVISPSGDLAARSNKAHWLLSPPYPSRINGEDADKFRNYLLELGNHLKVKGVLFPLADKLVEFVAENSQILFSNYNIVAPSLEIYNTLSHKGNLGKRANDADVPFPRTFEGLLIPDDFPLPAIVKPTRSPGFLAATGVKAYKATTRLELNGYLTKIKEAGFEPLTQEYIPGPDANLYTYGGAFWKGVPLAHFTGRKLLQYPPGVGDCAIGEAQPIARLKDLGCRLLASVGFTGVAQVEFKYDPRDDEYKLLEVNPRPWSWHQLAAHSGSNLALAAYLAAIGKSCPPELCRQITTPTYWRYGRLWLLSTLRLLLTRQDWKWAYRYGWLPALNAVCSQGDLAPLRAYLPQLGRTVLGELALKLRNDPSLGGKISAD